ncbi:MAG: hypothetical protein HQM09_17860 [Candidatus Riflebacteria bacterium]|nr:hypothetical protein [Candidatus Riflebacteria bacterium]
MVRAQGTFTSITGQVMFIGSSLAMLLSSWILPPKERPVGRIVLVLASVAIISMIGVSGSRSAFVLAFIVLLFTQLSSLFWLRRRESMRAFVFPILIVMVGAWIIVSFYTTQFETLAARVVSLSSENTGYLSIGEIVLRPWGDIEGAWYAMFIAPVFGYGLGTGGNAGMGFGGVIAEGEWSRHIIDLGPFLGLAFIVLRVAFVWVMGREAVFATRSSNNPLPLYLFGFVAVVMFNGQLIGQGAGNGYGWIFSGLCMASSKIAMSKKSS